MDDPQDHEYTINIADKYFFDTLKEEEEQYDEDKKNKRLGVRLLGCIIVE